MANPIKVLGTVDSIEPFGDGVYRVRFCVPSRATRFLPGQFLHLTLDDFDPTTGYWPESRVFSIASEPRQNFVTVVYSVKGRYTKRMEAELTVGRPVWLKLPYGDFVIDEGLLHEGPLVLIAGGTGVAPYLPFLKGAPPRSGLVHLFYGIRQPEHLLFRSDWEGLRAQPWFQLHLAVEQGRVAGLPHSEGRLAIDEVQHEVGRDFARGHFFLSGPPLMIETFEGQLKTLGIMPRQIHRDEWE